MSSETLLLTAVLAPTAGSFVLPFLGRAARLRNALAVVMVCVALACSLGMIPSVMGGNTVTAGHWQTLGMPSVLSADALAVFVACVSSLVSAVVVIYSLSYIRHYPYQNEYYFMVVLFLGAMMGLVFSANLLLLYVFWEITAIASWRLIGFFREEGYVRRADKAFLITMFGAVSMLVGFIIVYSQTGSFDLATISNKLNGSPLPDLAVGLIMLGILSKSATLPLHTWLPDAGVAPSPVTALLHAAVLVKIGVYVFARLFVVSFAFSPFWHSTLLVIAAASALVSAGAALVDTDIKRIIAYSTVSQIAFIFLGLASGSIVGVAGAVLYILMHGLAKGGLFLCAGIVEHNTHTKDITRMGGLIKTMPITAVSFLLCAFSVMGIPPFGGFFSKYMVMSGAVQGGHLWIALTFLVGAIMTMLYLFRLFNRVFLGEAMAPAREGSPLMVACVAFLALLGLVAGIAIQWPSQLALAAVGQVMAIVKMTGITLLWPILLPAAAGLLVVAGRSKRSGLAGLTILALLANLALAIWLFAGIARGHGELTLGAPWAGMGMDLALRLYPFSAFILLAAAGFSAVIALYCWRFMQGREHQNLFYACMLWSVAMVNGAVLADHLIVLLFFWEGLLVTMFGMIAIGRPGAWKTATKAVIIVGVSDLCMMVGIALAGWLGHSFVISQIHLSVAGLAGLAMVLLIIGATAKAGSMPFHTWIPDAAVDSPLPFMAFLPASLEKLLGIYFLARISLDMFDMTPGSWVSMMLMILGAATILLAVAMALVQKDYKRLLSYHAISQVGYMILGIGTAVPIGIVGGLFHMLNHALYKSGLFLSGGAVERQAGTTDLAKLGGLARNMPVTFACFFITAASISGVPPFNGFFSKELVYDGALSRGVIFYAAALLGSVLTAASFLKLGHAAYFGRRDASLDRVKEAPVTMLAPMIVIAGFCVLFGVYNALPLDNLIVPVLTGSHFAALHGVGEHHFAGWPSATLLAFTLGALAIALLNHLYGVRRGGSGLGASDHIHYAPVLSTIYDRAERRWFDPYDLGLGLTRLLSGILWRVDRAIDWLSDRLVTSLVSGLSAGVRFAHGGSYATYTVWCILATVVILLFLMRAI